MFALAVPFGPCPSPAAAEDLVVTYRAPESPGDTRYDYDNRVLALALEKTRGAWGATGWFPARP